MIKLNPHVSNGYYLNLWFFFFFCHLLQDCYNWLQQSQIPQCWWDWWQSDKQFQFHFPWSVPKIRNKKWVCADFRDTYSCLLIIVDWDAQWCLLYNVSFPFLIYPLIQRMSLLLCLQEFIMASWLAVFCFVPSSMYHVLSEHSRSWLSTSSYPS